MKYLIIFMKHHKKKLVLAFILLLGQCIGTLLIPSLIAKMIDHGILKENMSVIITVGIQMFAVAIFATAIAAWGSWVTSDLGSRFGYEMRQRLFKKIQEQSIEQFNQFGISSMITRSTSDITNLQQTMGMMLQMVVPSLILIVVSMGMTIRISVVMAMIQLIFMVVLIIISSFILKRSNHLSKSIQTRLDKINKVVREAICGVRVIRAFGNEKHEENRSIQAYTNYAENMIQLNRLIAIFTPIIWLLMGVLMIVILGLGGLFSIHGTMAVGQIAAVTEYATLTIGYLMMAVSTLSTLPKARACLMRLQAVLDEQPSITDPDNTLSYEHEFESVIEFNHINFAYPGAEENVIHDLTFSIKAGQTFAMIGSTGSGKSTIADLILRLHDLQNGTIKLNGINLQDLSQHDIRERVSCVPQKAFLFSGTIAENLRMGNDTASDDALWEALRIAQADAFVNTLSDKLQAPVSQGGTNFSGGQRQRLSIARALVKKADLFIFDDCFSALDVKTDAALRRALREHIKQPAKLIVAQRVSSIIDADQILVLHEGRLAGIGTHEQLLKSCQTYIEIVESQFQKQEV